ncbi:MAG: hypothetical protein LBE18_05365 [Planctomycetaceae bacterium]|jgi:hypothetical protein|nr:hypothetical protein [Planctomycetaceae bacterium]
MYYTTNLNRTSLINNILNADQLDDNVVISAIQSLYHVAEEGDEKYLFQLLKNKNYRIVTWALVFLYVNFKERDKIKEQVFLYASQYPSLYPLDEQEDISDLQLHSLRILHDIAFDDENALRKLIEIAEDYIWIPSPSDSAINNAFIWEYLGEHVCIKIKSEERDELIWNIRSKASNLIRNKVRKALNSSNNFEIVSN